MTNTTHLPLSKTGQRFCQFFNHRFNFIKAPNTGEESPQWKTISDYPIEHRNLWNAFCSSSVLIGLSFAPTTHYALLDIDARSPYHPATNELMFKALLGAYEDVGFNAVIVVQSSLSEGIHVYLPLPADVPTYELAVMLRLTAIRSGFQVKDGILEIFPNAKPYSKRPSPYKAHRLPLQAGSYLLDQDYCPYSNSIKTFLDLVEQAASEQDFSLIQTAMAAAKKVKSFRWVKGDGSKAAAFASDLQEQIVEGWTDFGQTNDLLRVIGTYGRVFEGLGGDSLTEYIASTAQSLPGYREFCRHQYQIAKRAKEWSRCIEKFYYPYGEQRRRAGTFQDLVNEGSKENKVNHERQVQAVERIKAGMKYLRETLEQLPRRVGQMKEALIEAICSLFGLRPSDKTLNKYRELWHPKFNFEEEEVIVTEEVQTEVTEIINQEVEQPEEVSPTPELVTDLASETNSKKTGPTPLNKSKNEAQLESESKSVPVTDTEFSALPPLYMKVSEWAKAGTVLEYDADYCYSSLVKLQGEAKPKLQSIQKSQQVIINSLNHSSYLFHSEDVSELMVYVIPVEEQNHWLEGVMVKAMYLVEPSAKFT